MRAINPDPPTHTLSPHQNMYESLGFINKERRDVVKVETGDKFDSWLMIRS